MIYERLCHIGERVPLFRRVGERSQDSELRKAAKFLSPIMDITVIGVVSASYLIGFLSLLSVFLALTVFQVSVLIALPLSAIFSVIAYYSVISYPVSLMNGYRLSLSEEADIVYEQFVLVFQSGGTIFEKSVVSCGISFMSKSDLVMQLKQNCRLIDIRHCTRN